MSANIRVVILCEMFFCILKTSAFLRVSTAGVTLSILLVNQNLPAAEISTYVVGSGATPAGVCAAIGAAREGVTAL